MKHFLLGTSALIGAVAIAASASAQTPKVTLGGFIDWQAGITSDDQDTNRRSHAFFNDTEISVNVDGKSDAGLGYGAEIVLEADVTDDVDAEGTNASRTFIYLDGTWGRVELGSTEGVQTTMKVDAASIARASGGIDGDFYRFIAAPTTVGIVTPDLPVGFGLAAAGSYGSEAQENINKIVYYTPRFSGFQLGLNYSPNDRDRGQTIDRTDNNAGRVEDVFGGAISWEGQWDVVSIALAATGEIGSAELATTEDLQAWNAGAVLGYMGFSLAGSYGHWGESYRATALNADDSHYWTVGGAYEHGPYGVSVTYLSSEYDNGGTLADNDFDNIVVGADYKLAPGLTPYAEVNFFDYDAVGTANDNEGTVFLLGTQLNF